MQIDPNTIDTQPDLVASSEVLASGQRVYFRPLRGDQAAELGAYFTGLSQATRRVYGPHPSVFGAWAGSKPGTPTTTI